MRNKQPDDSWKERSKNVLAQGFPGTNSKRWTQYPAATPSHSSGYGVGPYLYDAWGNRLLDFPSGLGSLSLGYSNTRVIEAVTRQAFKGCSFTLPTTLEIETAETLSAIIPAARRVRFLKTGGEATSAAIRIARAATGRPLVLSQGYHGHGDLWTSMSDPALGVVEDFQVYGIPYQHPIDQPVENSGVLFGWNPEQVAAIIVEALHLEMNEAQQKWLLSLREYCTKHGIVLVFDEIITGFRVPKWTVSNMWSIEPDIICLGKGIANGYPLAVVAGKPEVMDAAEYFISSTFSGEAISLAACKATIREIEATGKSFKDLHYYGSRLQERLNALDPEIKFEGYGTRAMFNITNPTSALFAQEMVKSGILFGKAHFFHFGHLENNIEEYVMNIAAGVMQQIKNGKVKLEGEGPKETFKR